MLYTFKQPVRGGYYYIVIKADSDEEATQIATDIVGPIEHKTDRFLIHLSRFSEGTLVLDDKMQRRLNEMGWAHWFVRVPLKPYHERTGHYGFLPE